MKKASKPGSVTKPPSKRPATKPLAAKSKATAKQTGSDRSTPEYHARHVAALGRENLRMAKQASATKALAAKPKAMAKLSMKPKPREAEGQAELIQVVAQLALSAEKLAQAADRLTEATLRKSHERQDETFKTLSESIAERTASEEHAEVADVPDSAAPEQPAETAEGAKDE